MTRLAWDDLSSRGYVAGIDRGVLYPKNLPGVAWNGLISVQEHPNVVNGNVNHIDGQKYRTGDKLDEFSATLDAYTYPLEFDEILSNYNRVQTQKPFGLSYRTKSAESADGYDLHLVYNCFASPSVKEHRTLNADAEADTFSWDIDTVPERFPHHRASSHILIKSYTAKSAVIDTIEDILYGTDLYAPRMPTIPEIVGIFESNATLTITDFGDGTWQAEGPDEIVYMLALDVFEISWISAVYLTSDTYIVSSY